MFQLSQIVVLQRQVKFYLFIISLLASSYGHAVKEMTRYLVTAVPSSQVIPSVGEQSIQRGLVSLAISSLGGADQNGTVLLQPLHNVNFHASLRDRSESDRLLKISPTKEVSAVITPELKRVCLYKAASNAEVDAWSRYPSVTPPEWTEPYDTFETLSQQAQYVFEGDFMTQVLKGREYSFHSMSGSTKPSLNELRVSMCFDEIIKNAKKIEAQKAGFVDLEKIVTEKKQAWSDHVILDDLLGSPQKEINLLFILAPAEELTDNAGALSTPNPLSSIKRSSSTGQIGAYAGNRVHTLVGFEYIPFDKPDKPLQRRWDLIKEKKHLLGIENVLQADEAILEMKESAKEGTKIAERMKKSLQASGNVQTTNLLNSDRQDSSDTWQNTTCGCGLSFKTAALLKSHSQDSSDTRCRGEGKLNTTCGCGLSFESAALLKSHSQGCSGTRCMGKGKQNTTCGCGLSLESADLLEFHRQDSSDTRCRGKEGKLNTCVCGKSFESADLLYSHRRSSSDTRCNGIGSMLKKTVEFSLDTDDSSGISSAAFSIPLQQEATGVIRKSPPP